MSGQTTPTIQSLALTREEATCGGRLNLYLPTNAVEVHELKSTEHVKRPGGAGTPRGTAHEEVPS